MPVAVTSPVDVIAPTFDRPIDEMLMAFPALLDNDAVVIELIPADPPEMDAHDIVPAESAFVHVSALVLITVMLKFDADMVLPDKVDPAMLPVHNIDPMLDRLMPDTLMADPAALDNVGVEIVPRTSRVHAGAVIAPTPMELLQVNTPLSPICTIGVFELDTESRS